MADPVVGITNGVPTSGTGTITTLGQTLLDGANITQGAIADAAVTAGATGSISAKLRSLSRDIGSLVTAIGSTAWDLGSGTSGSRTQRVIIDSGQLAGNQTTAQAMAAGFQLTDPPTDGTFALRTGSLTETAPATDTASSGLNGRLQRIAQNITTLIAATLKVALQAATSGGLSRSRTLIPNNTTAIVVKSGAGQLYKIRATNNSATIAYIKLYDATSATAGSGTPVDTIMIPANASGAGIVDTTDVGTVHATGITYTVTTGIADADTGTPAANAYVVTMFYK